MRCLLPFTLNVSRRSQSQSNIILSTERNIYTTAIAYQHTVSYHKNTKFNTDECSAHIYWMWTRKCMNFHIRTRAPFTINLHNEIVIYSNSTRNLCFWFSLFIYDIMKYEFTTFWRNHLSIFWTINWSKAVGTSLSSNKIIPSWQMH